MNYENTWICHPDLILHDKTGWGEFVSSPSRKHILSFRDINDNILANWVGLYMYQKIHFKDHFLYLS